ncbi:Flp family type IVb pilin [Phreatobacter aquaticus]|uniref:Flp family type IVb pilin n=1 Tax=Phreatobacter aquaticus TaxID=2570229 RepID=A0A4D7QLA9_9HYPH|nr:Flp family type IVb pilin [Phreatobacter aquaticus]QCK85957.1 Flp family type IVb pilin [Phreatobacter aquaticus]
MTFGKALAATARRFIKDSSGATAIEYSIIAAGIAAVIIVAVNTVGSNSLNTFNLTNNNMK